MAGLVKQDAVTIVRPGTLGKVAGFIDIVAVAVYRDAGRKPVADSQRPVAGVVMVVTVDINYRP